MDCEPITSLISHAGKQTVQTYLEVEIVKLSANVNVNPGLNIKDYQVPLIAERLLENYKWESIEDFTLCFRRGACSFYGEIFRLDAAVIGNWFSKYLDEKYDALEQRKEKEKKSIPKDDLLKVTKEQEEKYGVNSDYYKEAQRIAGTLLAASDVPVNNAKENAYQKSKLENPYKYFTVRNLQIMALSQKHAEELVDLMVSRGELEEDI